MLCTQSRFRSSGISLPCPARACLACLPIFVWRSRRPPVSSSPRTSACQPADAERSSPRKRAEINGQGSPCAELFRPGGARQSSTGRAHTRSPHCVWAREAPVRKSLSQNALSGLGTLGKTRDRERSRIVSKRFHTINSGKVPIHFGQEPGEVEPVRACKTGGFEVSAGPVARFGGESGILAARLGAVAVVLVIGQESSEVPEFRLGSRRDRTATFAIGAHHRPGGDQDITKLMDVGSLDGLVATGGIDVVANLVSVPHRRANTTDPLVGPDRVEEALEWRQLSLLEHGHLLDHVLEDVSLGCITETMAGDLLHRDQADALFPAGVEGFVERRILIEPGVILEHDGIDYSPKSGRMDDLGPVLV